MTTTEFLVDTQLLFLFLVGSTARDYVGRTRRVKQYTKEDFDLLVDILSRASAIHILTQVLTETSNLIGLLDDWQRKDVFEIFRSFVLNTHELLQISKPAVNHSAFPRLGLTDAALLTTLDDNKTLLTDDLKLYLQAEKEGKRVVNFTHLRERTIFRA